MTKTEKLMIKTIDKVHAIMNMDDTEYARKNHVQGADVLRKKVSDSMSLLDGVRFFIHTNDEIENGAEAEDEESENE